MNQRALVNQSDSFKCFLETYKGKLSGVSKIDPNRAVSLALVAASKNPKLLQCDQKSILRCMMESSALGIMPFSALQLGYIIPYFNGKTKVLEAQFQLSYRGIVEIVRRSEKIISIEAHVVYENDIFECTLGTYPKLQHSPNFKEERGKPVAVYAVATHSGGERQFDIMSIFDVEKVRAKSKSPNSGPWVDFFDEMAKKTVVKRLCKYLPISDDSAEIIHKDNENESTIENTVIIPEVDLEDVKEVQIPSAIEAQKTSVFEQKLEALKAEIDSLPECEGKQTLLKTAITESNIENVTKYIGNLKYSLSKGQ